MHPHCGIEVSLRQELIQHRRAKHKCEENFDEMEELPSRVAKLSYKCIFDVSTCGKKLETVNKIASHICKSHLNRTEIRFGEADVGSGEANRTGPMALFSNILIVSQSPFFLTKKI
jgi:hypothetical protein